MHLPEVKGVPCGADALVLDQAPAEGLRTSEKEGSNREQLILGLSLLSAELKCASCLAFCLRVYVRL